MSTLLDLPDELLSRVLGHVTFRQQDLAACANSRLRAGVDAARRDAAAARMQDADRFIRGEPLPLVTELGMERDVTFSGAAPAVPPSARVLAAFDRALPPAMHKDGPLRQWYREAAHLEAGGDGRSYSTALCGDITYVGGRDDNQSPEGFGMTCGGDGTQDAYKGQWSDGFVHGLGMVAIGPPGAPYAWYHGYFKEGLMTAAGDWAPRSDRYNLLNRNWWMGANLLTYAPGEEPTEAELDHVQRGSESITAALASFGFLPVKNFTPTTPTSAAR